MEVTDVRIKLANNDSKLKAYASIVLDDCFVMRDLKVINGSRGFFVAMPSKKTSGDRYIDIAHPTDNNTRRMIEDAVITAYEQCTK